MTSVQVLPSHDYTYGRAECRPGLYIRLLSLIHLDSAGEVIAFNLAGINIRTHVQTTSTFV
jgi:hypothetical protein